MLDGKERIMKHEMRGRRYFKETSNLEAERVKRTVFMETGIMDEVREIRRKRRYRCADAAGR